jgi:hypothetical protein
LLRRNIAQQDAGRTWQETEEGELWQDTRQAEDTVFDPTNCTINNQILYSHSIARNVDYIKCTGGGTWLIETCEGEEEEEKYTWNYRKATARCSSFIILSQ